MGISILGVILISVEYWLTKAYGNDNALVMNC